MLIGYCLYQPPASSQSAGLQVPGAVELAHLDSPPPPQYSRRKQRERVAGRFVGRTNHSLRNGRSGGCKRRKTTRKQVSVHDIPIKKLEEAFSGLREGKPHAEMARMLGIPRTSLIRWHKNGEILDGRYRKSDDINPQGRPFKLLPEDQISLLEQAKQDGWSALRFADVAAEISRKKYKLSKANFSLSWARKALKRAGCKGELNGFFKWFL